MSTTITLPRDSRRILKFFRTIPADVIAEGRDWYPRALKLAVELARVQNGGLPQSADENEWWEQQVNRAAAVIAVLSPQVNWERNKFLAEHVYSLVIAGFWHSRKSVDDVREAWPHGLSDGAGKAFRILVLGEDPDDVVKGPKVRQFWHTIVDPTDPLAVVVDRHAWAVAFGRVLTDEELGQLTGRRGAYDHVAQLYRNAAKILTSELGATITPAEVQAITWTHWRRTMVKHAKANRRNELKEI